jgi:hypothetical protein
MLMTWGEHVEWTTHWGYAWGVSMTFLGMPRFRRDMYEMVAFSRNAYQAGEGGCLLEPWANVLLVA